MYLDSCILVKLFCREPDSEFYGELVDGQPVASSVLAFTEVWSALLAKERGGRFGVEARRRAWAGFERAVQSDGIELVPMSPALFVRANGILEKCHPKIPLRSLDALHLACADQTQDWPLATSDARMRAAAAKLGYPLAPVAGEI